MPHLAGIPFELLTTESDVWEVQDEGRSLVGHAPPGTDLYINPGGEASTDAASASSAPTLLGEVGDGDFTFSARVTVAFAGQFDAGVLLVWAGETHFAKFCFEYSPDDEPMVVSVVTRGVSDDSNAFTVEGSTVWLRIARTGRVYALHASLDGNRWVMVRVFALTEDVRGHRVGFEVQSPMGDGCHVTFEDIRFGRDTLKDLRDGS